MTSHRAGFLLLFAIAVGPLLSSRVSAQSPTKPGNDPAPEPLQAVAPPQVAQPADLKLPVPVLAPPVVPSAPLSPVPPVFTPTPAPGIPSGLNMPVQRRFAFTIDEKAPIEQMLPKSPAKKSAVGPLLDDLAKVPEIEYQERTSQKNTIRQQEEVAHQIAKINHVNAKKTDAFMTALLANREDLAGLPFAMGNACRSTAERAKQFSRAVDLVRQAQRANTTPTTKTVMVSDTINGKVQNILENPSRTDEQGVLREFGRFCDLTAPVPVPGQPLPPPSQGYGQSQFPDMMVRIDVTYLRQDFSVRQSVPDANPWPEMQRFDFLVRERKLTSEEAAEFRTKLMPTEAGVLSPYHRSALAALRELTGKETAPTAEAWRKLLALHKTEPVKAEVRD